MYARRASGAPKAAASEQLPPSAAMRHGWRRHAARCSDAHCRSVPPGHGRPVVWPPVWGGGVDAAPTGMKKGELGMATAVPLGLAAAARTWERRGGRA